MHYQPRDCVPLCDFGFWPETLALWHELGLPEWVTYDNAWRSRAAFRGQS